MDVYEEGVADFQEIPEKPELASLSEVKRTVQKLARDVGRMADRTVQK